MMKRFIDWFFDEVARHTAPGVVRDVSRAVEHIDRYAADVEEETLP